MSVVVALKDNDKIIVGIDIRTVNRNGPYFDSYKARPKAFHFDEDKTVIGAGVGNAGLLDVLQLVYENHKKDKDIIDRRYVVKYFVPELIQMAHKRNYTIDNGLDGALLLLIKDKGFVIGSNCVVLELDEYHAMGCGDTAALASLYTSKDYYAKPINRVIKAIKTAAFLDNNVSSCVFIGSTAGEPFSFCHSKIK